MFHKFPHDCARHEPFKPIFFTDVVEVKHDGIVESELRTLPHTPDFYKPLPNPENFTVEAYASAGIPLKKVNSKLLSNIDADTATTIVDKALASENADYNPTPKTEE